jgi:DNA (cytosine-5)-methyltransferase 1
MTVKLTFYPTQRVFHCTQLINFLLVILDCDYGDPQGRPRLIIFAAKNEIPMPESPHPTHGPKCERPYTTVKDALEFLRAPGGMSFPNSEPVNNATYDPENDDHAKLDPDGLAPALLAAAKYVFHYDEDRLLTVREIAALQSFPHDYKFYGTRAEQIRQIATAVPVGLARAIGRTIREALRDYYAFELEGGNHKAEASLTIDDDEDD